MTYFMPADWPVPIPTSTLYGNLISIEPLTVAHAKELSRPGADPVVWRFTTSRADEPESMSKYVRDLVGEWQRGTAAPFVVRHKATARLVGCTRLKQLDRKNRSAVVGSWYTPEVWRTGVNLEAKLLLLRYAFEELGCVRIEFHTDSRNERSRISLERLGATLEGILRAHQIRRDGTLRDSAIYSILQSEWPIVYQRIRARMKT